jgi:hypothetical protein
VLEYLTTDRAVGIISNMKAELLMRTRVAVGEDAFAEFVLWRVPVPIRGSSHSYKYRLALVENGICTVRYDNETGKSDHRHIGEEEEAYRFTSVEQLIADFTAEIEKRRRPR